MKGIAFSNSDLEELLPSDLTQYNEYYWLVSTQGGWAPLQTRPSESDWDEFNQLLDKCLLEIQGSKYSNINLIDTGCFSKIIPHLRLDEWTYLIGFQTPSEYLGCLLEDQTLFNPLTESFFKSLTKATAICYIDQWWECFPSESTLLNGIGTGLKQAHSNSDKWILFNENYRTSIHSNFT